MDVQRSTALLAQIDGLAVPFGQLALWSLGQAGFVVKGGATIAYIDPYLSNSIGAAGGPQRRFPAPLDPAAIRHAQMVFATHEHADHTDMETLSSLLAASPTAPLICSPQSRAIALEAGLADSRITLARLGERVAQPGLAYTAIPAAHYQYEVDADGHARWMGFLIECNGVSLYHAGDTLLFPELLAALGQAHVDIALLPINGRDYFREQQDIVGNLLPEEAVQLAQQLRARLLIGMHNDLFAENRLPAGALFDALDRLAPWQRCHTLQPGELYLYAG